MHLGLRTITSIKRLASSSQCPCIWSRNPHFAWPPGVQHLTQCKKSKLLRVFFYKDLALGVWSNIPNHPAPGGSQKSKQILGGLFSPRLEAILSKQIMESGLLTWPPCGPHPCLWCAKVWTVERSPRDFEQSQWHSDEKQKPAGPRCPHPKFELLLASIWYAMQLWKTTFQYFFTGHQFVMFSSGDGPISKVKVFWPPMGVEKEPTRKWDAVKRPKTS